MISVRWTSKVSDNTSDWESRADRWIAILGSSVPVAMVLGVVVYEFFISLTGLLWLISRVKFTSENDRLSRNALFWPLCSWFAAVVISRIVNGGTAFLFMHDTAFIRFPLYVIAMLDISRRLPVHRYLIGGLMAGMAYATLNLLSAHIIGYDFIGKPLSRYVGKLNEGARTGGLSAYAAPFFFLWGIFDRNLDKRKRIWIFIFGFIGVLLLISSRVRTALFAAVIGLIGGFFSRLIIRKQLKAGGVVALILLAGIGAWGVWRMQLNLESIYDRIYFWKVSWQVWLKNPIAGVGISSFNEAYRAMAESGVVAPINSPGGAIYQSVNPRHAHNLFLQLMVCNGILGIASFGWIFYRAVKIVLSHCRRWHTGLLSWPFICLAIGLTGWNIYDPWYASVVVYFLLLIGIASGQEAKTRSA